MIYTEKLLQHPEYISILKEISDVEKDRIFCKHELAHMLDVCRIAWIRQLERAITEGVEIDFEKDKDRLYLTGLLHDIGRAAQAKTGICHTEAGIEIAKRLLKDIGCPEDWIHTIIATIAAHRGRAEKKEAIDAIAADLYEADHLSRNCFLCNAQESCKWQLEDYNTTIQF